MEMDKEFNEKNNSTIFILYKNKMQTLFKNLDNLKITDEEIFLTGTNKMNIIINKKAVQYYKVY